jgi:hypothetical protein
VVLTLLGVLALARNQRPTDPNDGRRDGRLVATGQSAGGDGSVGDTAGGGAAPDVATPVLPLFPSTTTTGRPGKTTSTAVPGVAGRGTTDEATVAPPRLGTYTYAVDGTEAMAGAGSRKLPPSMRLGASRPTDAAADEVVFDLNFSDQHTEREIVAFRSDRIAVRHESINVVFGLRKRSTQFGYSPAVGRAVVPLASSASRSGASTATDGSGTTMRTEDWKATDVAKRSLTVAGSTVEVWEISTERTSRPGAVEQFHETRRAWFDPARRMFVKWESHVHTERTSGVSSAYDLNYTATFTTYTPPT